MLRRDELYVRNDMRATYLPDFQLIVYIACRPGASGLSANALIYNALHSYACCNLQQA